MRSGRIEILDSDRDSPKLKRWHERLLVFDWLEQAEQITFIQKNKSVKEKVKSIK